MIHYSHSLPARNVLTVAVGEAFLIWATDIAPDIDVTVYTDSCRIYVSHSTGRYRPVWREYLVDVERFELESAYDAPQAQD